MDIPLPEEDDLSEDKFEGYIDEVVDNGGNGNSDVGEGNDGQDGDNDGGEGNDGQENDNGDPMIPEYTEHPGCTSVMTEKSPPDLFQLFVTDDMLEAIIKQTKLFAQQYMDSHELARRSRMQQWVRSAHVHDVAEQVPCDGHHHGADQLPLHRGLLGHIVAVCHGNFQLYLET